MSAFHSAEYRPHFGPWTVLGPALSKDEVDALSEGTEVEITWSGGNGPHRYVLVRDTDVTYAVATHDDPNGPMRHYNRLDWFIGPHPRTEVRLVPQPDGSGADD